jgi:hypothetical protein
MAHCSEHRSARRRNRAAGGRSLLLAALTAALWLGGCAGPPAAPAAPTAALPDDVPTWPGARVVADESTAGIGRQLRYACEGDAEQIASFYAAQLRQRGWQVERRPGAVAGAARDAATGVGLGASKPGRALGVEIRSDRCGIELLLLVDAAPEDAPPEL